MDKPHIFLTNDDGYEAPGIRAMAKELATFARVTVICPHRPRSSCASSLTLHEYLRMWKREPFAENTDVLTVTGTTADCGKIALEYYLKDDAPDLIVSGVNNGFNVGTDCLYSGTVAGILEGIYQNIPGIAVSVEDAKDEELLKQATALAADVIRLYFLQNHWKGLLNLNIPRGDHLSLPDIKIVRQGLQHYENAIRALKDPSDRTGYWISGKAIPTEDTEEDTYWIFRGYPTLTPLLWTQTDSARLTETENILRLAQNV